MNSYRIYSINGPIVTVRGATDLQIMEMVYVGVKKLVGEVIGVDSEKTTIQVYEDTAGLYPLEPVESTGLPMSIAGFAVRLICLVLVILDLTAHNRAEKGL